MGSLDNFAPKQFVPSSDTESVLQDAIAAEKAKREVEKNSANAVVGVENANDISEVALAGSDEEPGMMRTEALKNQTTSPESQLGADIELVPSKDEKTTSQTEASAGGQARFDLDQDVDSDDDVVVEKEMVKANNQQELEKKDIPEREESEEEIRKELESLENGGDFSSPAHSDLQRRLVVAHNKAKNKSVASNVAEVTTQKQDGAEGSKKEDLDRKKGISESILAGEDFRQELLVNKESLEKIGETETQNYKKIVERLTTIEAGLKELREQQQRESMEEFIAREDKVGSEGELKISKKNLESNAVDEIVKGKQETSAKLDVISEDDVISSGSDDVETKPLAKKITPEAVDGTAPTEEITKEAATIEEAEFLDEVEDDVVEMEEVDPDVFEVGNEKARSADVEVEPSAELSETELKSEADLWHGNFVDAQRAFQKKKHEMGLLKGIWQKFGGLGLNEGEKEELNQLKVEFDKGKITLKETELMFQKKYREYSQFIVNKKRQEIIEGKKKALEEDDQWKNDPEKIKKYLADMPKQKFFIDEIKNFVLSGEAVSITKKEDGAEVGVEQKISLFQDMNEKIKEVDRARMEALSERDLNLLQKGLGHAMDLYKSVPRKYKIAVGAILAGGLAAGTAVAGGATAGLAISVGAFSGSRRALASLAGGALGAKVFKVSQENQGTKRAERKAKSETKMAKEYAEGEKEVDLYALLQNRLKQEKMDNYKSLALAGAAGFVVGAGTRGAFGLVDHLRDVPVAGTEVGLDSKTGKGVAEGVAKTETLNIDPNVAKDWEEILSGKSEIPSAYGDLAVFDSFRDFVEERGGKLDYTSKDVLKQWEEYSKVLPEEAKSSRHFHHFDRLFNEYKELSGSPRRAARAFGHIERLLRGAKDDFELRVHGAELAEKMGVEYNGWAEDPNARLQAGVVTEVGGHKVPLNLLSEEDRLKVETARKISAMNQPLTQGESADGATGEEIFNQENTENLDENSSLTDKQESVSAGMINVNEKLLEMKIPVGSNEWFAIKEVPAKDFLEIMKTENDAEMLKLLKKEVAELPGRVGKLAVFLDRDSVTNLRQMANVLEGARVRGMNLDDLNVNDFATKAVIENVSGKPIVGAAGIPDEILNKDDGEIAGGKKEAPTQPVKEANRSWQEKVASKEMSMTEIPDSEFEKTVSNWKMKRESGDMPSLSEDRDYKRALRVLKYREKSGISIPDPEETPSVESEVKEGRGEHSDDSAKFNLKEGDFKTRLVRGDSLWDTLKKISGGDEMEAAKKLVSFKGSVAEVLANEYQLTPKIAQEYVTWRLKNLEVGDVVSIKGGEISLSGFVDEEHIDRFLNKNDNPKVMMV